MNHSKHSPGPWIVDRHADNEELVVRSDPDWGIVANCQTDSYSLSEQENLMAEIQANARLIAAAPEMLNMLLSVENWFREYDVQNGPDSGSQLLLNNIRAAIAKATGEPQK